MDTVQILLIAILIALVAAAGAGLYVVTHREEEDVEEGPSSVAAPPRRGLGDRLSKTSQSLGGALRGVFARSSLDQEFWDGMEEALIQADVGVAAATDIVGRVRSDRPEDADQARAALSRELRAEFDDRDRSLHLGDAKPSVIMVVGVNGAGKTTSIAKLANRIGADRSLVPLLGAADTFRAGADAQLRTWGQRLGVDVVGGQEGADPAAVAYDAYAAARSRGRDVVFIDTAGRLQSKHNLMAELGKIRRVLDKEAGSVDEVLLVLDATGGQNAINQVAEFTTAAGVTGIVLTKLDGTARGGVVVAVERDLAVPVKFIGVGEGIGDLVDFVPDDFVAALLSEASND